MAERLGEALLELRTNDAAFNAGITQAEGRAQKLGQTLDRTRGSSAQLAGEMVATGRSAAQMGAGFEQAGQRVTNSAGQQRAGMQQLSFQLNDVATMYALGARPMQIFASQSGQVIQSIQMMSGGTSRLAAFLGGPWGLAVTSAVIVLTPFISKLFDTEKAMNAVEFASDRMGDAQSILGGVIDQVTGKINTQSEALLALARAQAVAGRISAMERQAEAGRTLTDIRRGEVSMFGPMGFTRPTRVGDGTEDVVTNFVEGRVGASFAIGSLESRLKAGRITTEAFQRAAQAITNFEVEGANVRVFEELQAALNGDDGAARGLLGADPRPGAGSRGRAGPDQAQIDARAESQLVQLTQQILRARMQIAVSAEERAELAERAVEWDRRTQIAQIEGDTQLSEAQKAELSAAVDRLADAELQAIAFTRRAELAREAQALADERFRGEAEALQIAGQLADTEAERRDIALRLYDAQVQMERIALQTIIDMAARGEIEKREGDLASQRLANLEANAATGRAAVARQNETELERYLRVNINRTQGQINEAIDGIRIDGLEALNDGLARAIMGAESLGDVFSRVADQIIADLLRIAIQQAIIKPLANSLFGGGGGGGFLGSLFGGGAGSSVGGGASAIGNLFSAFAGGRAKGGMIPTGKFAVVGEEGPELAFAGSGGIGIMSNPDSRRLLSGAAGGMSINMPIKIDATGADAAAIARLNSKIDELKDQLPGTIVETVRDARDRRFL